MNAPLAAVGVGSPHETICLGNAPRDYPADTSAHYMSISGALVKLIDFGTASRPGH